jgi:hypothetical protein
MRRLRIAVTAAVDAVVATMGSPVSATPQAVEETTPKTVAQKIAANLTTLQANRFDLKYAIGGLSHEALMTNIELYGTQVIPRVRELLKGEYRFYDRDAFGWPVAVGRHLFAEGVGQTAGDASWHNWLTALFD